MFGCVWLCLAVFLLILWISEGALGRFSVRFCGLFVLLCLAVLLVAGASGALLSDAVECFIQFLFKSRSSSLSLSFWLLLFGLVFLVSMDFRRDVRHFFGAILWLVRPSVPCRFAGGRCFWCSLVGMLVDAAGRCFWCSSVGMLFDVFFSQY